MIFSEQTKVKITVGFLISAGLGIWVAAYSWGVINQKVDGIIEVNREIKVDLAAIKDRIMNSKITRSEQ